MRNSAPADFREMRREETHAERSAVKQTVETLSDLELSSITTHEYVHTHMVHVCTYYYCCAMMMGMMMAVVGLCIQQVPTG